MQDRNDLYSLYTKILRKLTRYYARLKRQEELLDIIRATAIIKLHLGCGNKYLQDYINVDAYSNNADVKADILELDPFMDGSIDLIETHHVLEHLSFRESDAALRKWFRKLKQDGHIIISVPDISACCKIFIRTPEAQRWGTGSVIQMIYGSQEHDGMFHKSGYTCERLSALLGANGFLIKLTLRDYPCRPTPSFLILAQKITA